MAIEKTINNISEYIQEICQMDDEINKYKYFHDDVLLFRGQADKDYELIPAIARNRQYAVQCTIFNEERNLIEMAKFKMPDIFRNDLEPIELLALLQHHGIPTRLLDITENALVALYFACCDNIDKDGEVIVFKNNNDDIANYPVINAIADSYRFTRGTWTPLSTFFANVKEQPYFLEQKYSNDVLHKDDTSGGNWIAECCKNIIYICAPIRSMRQQVQQGRYILFPNSINNTVFEDNSFEKKIDAISKEHEDIIARIIIPQNIKKQLISNLSVLGVTEEFLFCDSVDKVCKGILDSFKKKYNKV